MERKEILRNYINELSKYYKRGTSSKLLPLAHPVLNTEEEVSAIDAILDNWFPTMGERVKNFESLFSNYIGSNFGVMVNSGSSANLLSVGAIKEIFNIKNGSEVM